MNKVISLAFCIIIFQSLFFSKNLHASVDFSCGSKSPNIFIRILFVGDEKWDHFKRSKTAIYKHDIQVFIDRNSGPPVDAIPDVTVKSKDVRKFLFANKSIEIRAVDRNGLSIMEFFGDRKSESAPFLINGFIYMGPKKIQINNVVFDCGAG